MIVDKDADLLRNLALKLEKEDFQKAKRLMELALIARPHGPFIQQKVKEYEDKAKRLSKVQLGTAFLHIPKTAGTSFRTELLIFFGESKVFPSNNDLKKLNGHYPHRDQLTELLYEKQESEIVTGHYGIDVFYDLNSKINVLTFFREPIARAISNLKHHQRNNKKFKDMTLMEIAQLNEGGNPEILNRQVDMLSGGKGRDLNAAIENLKTLSFVGLTEEYAKSIELCNKMMGWELKGDQFTNKGNSEQDQQITDELLGFLTENNQLDIQLYEAAVERFEKDCKKFLS